MTAVPVVLDCDPGHDDALALVLAAGSPRLRLLAISTVFGNQEVSKTTLNARLICSIAGISGVPIAAGSAGPIAGATHNSIRPNRIAHAVHGSTGLDGVNLGAPVVPVDESDAVSLLHRIIRDHPEPVTIIATGPLTNIARLIHDHPTAISNIKEIVCMGGSTDRGNVTPYGEFNIVADPEAASMVLDSPVPVTFCGLNATHQVLVSTDRVASMRKIGTPLANVCADLITFFAQTYNDVFNMSEPPLHDPVAVARVLDASIVECVKTPVAVELHGTHTRGATVIDLHRVTGSEANALVAVHVDIESFWTVMLDAIRVLPGAVNGDPAADAR
ncbi:MAG TPA: nucleoside hydrolase [Trebonia sp.]|nr:nucleoside hydrolase [Trebonia sp.]